MPEYEHSGLGINLFKLGFEILETEKPLLSVSDNMKSKFEKVFDYFGFKKEKSYYGLYLPFREEISFNGLLNEEVSNPLNSTYNFFFGENQCQKWSKNFSYEPYFYLRDVNKTLRHFPCGEMHYKFKKISTIELNEEDCHFHNNAIRDKLLRPS